MINFIGDIEKINSISLINKELVSRIKCNHFLKYDELVKMIIDCSIQTTISHTFPTLNLDLKNWIIIQPWEYSHLLKSMIEPFEKAGAIITPSNFCKTAFENSGIKTPIKVIPNGISSEFHVKPLEHDSFNFLYVGGLTFRKGFDILLNAFKNVFSKKDKVNLIVKGMGSYSFYQNQNYVEMLKSLKDDINIIYTEKDLGLKAMINMYNSCDCLVAPYRGEGFCMPVLEAMSCGLPCIVSDGATNDYIDENCVKIGTYKKFIDNSDFLEGAYISEPFQYILEQSLYEMYLKGKQLYKRDMSYYYWENIVNQYKEFLGE